MITKFTFHSYTGFLPMQKTLIFQCSYILLYSLLICKLYKSPDTI